MLLQFCFSNFKSFADDTTLDMRASGSNELEYHLRHMGNERVLPVAAIYGANASGKSNVFSAFHFMYFYVMYSFYFSQEDKNRNDLHIDYTPFAMSSSRNKEGKFEVDYILQEGNRYRYYNYGFVLDKRGIQEEWLKVNSKTRVRNNQDYSTLFYREKDERIELDPSMEKYRSNLEISLDSHVLLVSLGAKLKVKEFLSVYHWFAASEPYDCSDSLRDLLSKELPQNIVQDHSVKAQVLEFLRSFDDSIIDLKFKKNASSDESEAQAYSIISVHKAEDGKMMRIHFDDESAGTQKMFVLYQVLRDILEKGSILFADELDIKLHPLLMRNIILTFVDPKKNPNDAQLIFTTHNTIYMDMNLLRRDEIWFTEKKNHRSELYSLGDIVSGNGSKMRKDTNYEKNYLLGNYGAVPYLTELLGG